MEKKHVAFRLNEETIAKIKEIARTLNITDTETVTRAINSFYLQMKQEEQSYVSGALISIAEYQKAQEQIKQLAFKLGEAEGSNKEKDNVITILKEQLERVQSEISKNKKSFFDRLFGR